MLATLYAKSQACKVTQSVGIMAFTTAVNHLKKQYSVRHQMSEGQQLMQEVLGDVVRQVADHFQPPAAIMPETRSIPCMLQSVSILSRMQWHAWWHPLFFSHTDAMKGVAFRGIWEGKCEGRRSPRWPVGDFFFKCPLITYMSPFHVRAILILLPSKHSEHQSTNCWWPFTDTTKSVEN